LEKIFEKLGIFYLGKDLEEESLEPTKNPTLIKSKAFTTHAAIIGMTGSGKTGLGIGLLEEAAIDNIPIIAIDPKGDISNLALTFESMKAEDFKPWLKEEAAEKGVEVDELAKSVAQMWREGIESFGQDLSRVKRLKEHDVTIYTPGSGAGVPVNILADLNIPDSSMLEDPDTLSSTINSTVASLLALIGVEADPVNSREFILIAQIVKRAWMEGVDLDIGTLISQIITPPFSKIGVLPLDSFYTPAERFKLASKFNNILASPTFENWLKGDPLEIERVLYDEERRSKISIFSISHLSDEERMFFVTLLLNRVVGWMRNQSGTGRLRALLYMDEIYGYFPPSKNPPSKEPMMLLLKQARAFGVGMVLSTQNPVDLDYKGLSNIGTWFIGRLQTKQDIAKVIEGLSGKIGSSLSKKSIEKIISTLPKRTFFLKSTYMENVKIFGTRWVLSYLKGPLKKGEISSLMADKKRASKEERPKRAEKSAEKSLSSHEGAPILSSQIEQRFEPPLSTQGSYSPSLAAKAKVRFFNATRGIDMVKDLCLLLPLYEDETDIEWQKAEPCEEDFANAPKNRPSNGRFNPLPPSISSAKNLKSFEKELKNRLYTQMRLELYRCRPLKMESTPNESEESFKSRMSDILEELKSREADTLQERYEKKFQTLEKRRLRALQKLQKEQEDVSASATGSAIDAGLAIFGAIFGGKRTAATKVGRAIKGGSRLLKERADVKRAEEQLQHIEESIETLKYELEDKLDRLDEKFSPENYPVEKFFIKPRRSDIEVDKMSLYWRWE